MKKFLILALLLAPIGAIAAEGSVVGRSAHNMSDKRVSLGLSRGMNQHLLSNMRAHLEATQSIIGLLSEGKFEKASEVAHSKLGLTEEMKQMYDMFENEEFKKLGLAFHKSGDDLGNALQTKNMKAALRALNKTMQHCVKCHATFSQ